MNRCRRRERIDRIASNYTGTISYLQNRLSPLREPPFQERLPVSSMDTCLDFDPPSDGGMNRSEFSIETHVQITLRTFAQPVQNHRSCAPIAKFHTDHIDRVGLRFRLRHRHVRQKPDRRVVKEKSHQFKNVNAELEADSPLQFPSPSNLGGFRGKESLPGVEVKQAPELRRTCQSFGGSMDLHTRKLVIDHNKPPGLFAGLNDLVGLLEVLRQGLLTKNVTTSVHGERRMLEVQGGWGANRYDVRLGLVDQFSRVGAHMRQLPFTP